MREAVITVPRSLSRKQAERLAKSVMSVLRDSGLSDSDLLKAVGQAVEVPSRREKSVQTQLVSSVTAWYKDALLPDLVDKIVGILSED